MKRKAVPIIRTGFTKNFFSLDFTDEELISCPHLEVDAAIECQFVLELGDLGLSRIGIDKGDFLLFTKFAETDYQDVFLLVRCEGEYIIRVSNYITPVDSVLSTPGDVYEPITLPSENIRIVATCSSVIKPHDDLRIITVLEV